MGLLSYRDSPRFGTAGLGRAVDVGRLEVDRPTASLAVLSVVLGRLADAAKVLRSHERAAVVAPVAVPAARAKLGGGAGTVRFDPVSDHAVQPELVRAVGERLNGKEEGVTTHILDKTGRNRLHGRGVRHDASSRTGSLVAPK